MPSLHGLKRTPTSTFFGYTSWCHVWVLFFLSLLMDFLSVSYLSLIKSNQITFIVTSPQHKCLGEWNSYERAPDSAKKQQQQAIYIWTDSAKKQKKQFTYGQTVQKNCTGAFTVLQTVQKNNNNNLHMDSTYLQTVQKTMCKIHIHILSTHSVL